MSDLPIRPEAVEAAAKEVRSFLWAQGAARDGASIDAATAAIAAFCEVEGLTVERQAGAGVGWSQESTHQRLIGPWRADD